MAIKTAKELAAAAEAAAKNYKTLYVMGCFGAPMNATNKARYTKNLDYNKDATRTAMINAASADTFGFDCVCFIKGLLWGWNGNAAHVYGGATYNSNGVPDKNADQMIALCKDVSTDFNNIAVGEMVWMKGHCGIYIGNGLAVECTPKWENKVQITSCNCSKAGYNRRDWTKHGKLPYVQYTAEETKAETKEEPKKDESTEMYYVQVGAYSDPNAAADMVAKLKAAGFNAIVKTVAGVQIEVPDTKPAVPDTKPAAKIEVESVVKLNAGAKYYDGKTPQPFVYNRNHVVKEINGNRVVITYNGVTVGAVKLEDLTLVQ